MAESPPPPPIQLTKPGLGLLNPITTPLDLDNEKEVDSELRNSVEREISELSKFEENGYIHEQNNTLKMMETHQGNSERVEEENMTERIEVANNRGWLKYPIRPDAQNCSYYVKFGSCKFGSSCKFNHPFTRKNQGFKARQIPTEENWEKTEQTECKYYLTPGGCKNGENCKFSHGSDKSSVPPNNPEFNFLGLPIRPGEKECNYYMRNGTCMYGSNCRFHHPDPIKVAGGDFSNCGNGVYPPSQVVPSDASSWSSPRAFSDNSLFGPVTYSQTHGALNPYPDWDEYEIDDYPTLGTNLPSSPSFPVNNLQEYPERPGEEVECSFFLKNGVCKFKSSCRFDHLKKSIPKENSFALTDKGLPLRPDQPICTPYHRFGICKYGPGCKYDHPLSFSLSPSPDDEQQFGNSSS